MLTAACSMPHSTPKGGMGYALYITIGRAIPTFAIGIGEMDLIPTISIEIVGHGNCWWANGIGYATGIGPS